MSVTNYLNGIRGTHSNKPPICLLAVGSWDNEAE